MLRAFRTCLLLLVAAASCGLIGLATAQEETAVARLRRDVTYLASDECEGRGVGTKGINLAADYIAKQFAQAGLKPGGVDGGYFQPFTVPGAVKLDGPSSLSFLGAGALVTGPEPAESFTVLGLSGSGKVTAPLVFAGFGATAKDIDYDDYKGIDVKDKIVVLLRKVPRWSDAKQPFDGARKDEHASLERKVSLAETNGAVGVILVNDSSELPADKLMPFATLANSGVSGSKIPVVHVKRSLDNIFQSALGKTLGDLEKAINEDLKPRSAPLADWKATIEVSVKRQTTPVKNVLAVLEGAGPLANEIVVIGGHYDHLGYGGPGSRNKNKNAKEIHHGADDNASGSSAVIELARHFAVMPNRQGRKLVFMTFSGEEIGLLGSRYYCKDPLFPLDKTVAMVNLDMVGRLAVDTVTGKDKLEIEATKTSPLFEKMIEDYNPGFQLKLQPKVIPYSDHDSFYHKDIPVIFLNTGTHPDYHRPTDTADKINYEGMSKIVDYTEKIIVKLSSDEKRPVFVKAGSASPPKGNGAPNAPRLGIMPDYGESEKGLKITDVTDDGPGAKAGLKAGDLIVEVAGKSVGNVNGYMVIMAEQQIGRPIEIGVLRDGKKMTLKVTPQ